MNYLSRIYRASKAGALPMVLMAAGCSSLSSLGITHDEPPKPLSTNTINDFERGKLNVNEEPFKQTLISIYGKRFYAASLEVQEKNLSAPYMPGVYLIPEDQARVAVRNVGAPGGEVLVDSPEGFNYFPYSVEFDTTSTLGKALLRAGDLKKEGGLVRLVVPTMKNPVHQSPSKEDISLLTLTEKDFPFEVHTLEVRGERYMAIPMGEKQEFAPSGPDNTLTKDNTLPYFFVAVNPKEGIDVEFGGKSTYPEHPRICARAVVFSKSLSFDKYTEQRFRKQDPQPAQKPQKPAAPVPSAIGDPNAK